MALRVRLTNRFNLPARNYPFPKNGAAKQAKQGKQAKLAQLPQQGVEE